MPAKSNQLIFKIRISKSKWWLAITSILFFAQVLAAAAQEKLISIKEFNERSEAAEDLQYDQFQRSWVSFLKRESENIPKDHSPAWVRKATEEFLFSTGGKKAKFAKASQQNTYGFTFKKPDDDPHRKASFHRSHRSIFMDLEQAEANEWLMLFVHEVAHSLDSELYNSIALYSDQNWRDKITEHGQADGALSDLSAEEWAQLDQWLIAGLNRGFLAEYRAWYITYVIYEEGLRDGTFRPVQWLEDVKKTKPASLSMRTHIFRYLSPSWVDPDFGLFKYNFVQEALKELRQKLYAHPELVKWGQMKKLL